MTAFWKCCIWQPWISRKNGLDTGRTGGRSTPSLKSILKSVWSDATCKTSLFWAGLIDMPKNSCIMQIWAESGKPALPICNYSQILYQFLAFTQNLKRSYITEQISHNNPLFSCMIIRKLIITRFLSFNIVVQYNSDTMDFWFISCSLTTQLECIAATFIWIVY